MQYVGDDGSEVGTQRARYSSLGSSGSHEPNQRTGGGDQQPLKREGAAAWERRRGEQTDYAWGQEWMPPAGAQAAGQADQRGRRGGDRHPGCG